MSKEGRKIFGRIITVGLTVAAVGACSAGIDNGSKSSLDGKLVSDPAQLYSLVIPTNWHEGQIQISTNTTGIGTPQQKTQRIEVAQFTSPDSPNKQIGLTIQASKSFFLCNNTGKPNATIDRMPAHADDGDTHFTIDTKEGTYDIRYILGGRRSKLSSKEKNNDKITLKRIIKTIKLNNRRPADC